MRYTGGCTGRVRRCTLTPPQHSANGQFLHIFTRYNLPSSSLDLIYVPVFLSGSHFRRHICCTYYYGRAFFNGNIFFINLVSLPLLALRLGEYWFRISLYVSDRNRPLAPIRRQRWCSLMYDVYLTCIKSDV